MIVSTKAHESLREGTKEHACLLYMPEFGIPRHNIEQTHSINAKQMGVMDDGIADERIAVQPLDEICHWRMAPACVRSCLYAVLEECTWLC